jgi:hypothetical protein
LRRLQP